MVDVHLIVQSYLRFDAAAGNVLIRVAIGGVAIGLLAIAVILLFGVVPGRVPGSYATYDKTLDASGKTISYTKTTVAPDGHIVHVKDKFNP